MANELGAWLAGPPSGNVLSSAQNGTATQTVADFGVTVGANKVFFGSISIAATATTAAGANAAGTLHVEVSWVAGTGGTASQRVCSLDLSFPSTGVSGAAQLANGSNFFEVALYAGTTSGKFQYTVATTGTIGTLMYDIVVNGQAA